MAIEMRASIRQRIELARTDAAELQAIRRELVDADGPDAAMCRLKIARLLEGMNASQDRGAPVARGRLAAVSRVQPASLWKAILSAVGLQAPDGRPLHKYKFGATDAAALRERVRAATSQGSANPSTDAAALFVVWASHWFHLEYRGGVRRWEDVGAALGSPLSGSDGRRLAADGLKAWRRPPVKGDGLTLWLRTLAVEGGFPARLLSGEGGWAGIYMERLVSRLLQYVVLTEETALEAAEALCDCAPAAYRQEVFYAVAADLALAVVRLRRETEEDERARGVPASAWLDETKPGWRADLPIDAGDDGAARLIDGLMRVEIVASGALGCERLLRRVGDRWVPALKLGLDGLATGELAAGLKRSSGRLRAFPAGLLARYAAGELALLEPPGDDETSWRIRPSRREAVLPGVPFSTPVRMELRQDGRGVAEVGWPGGEAVRGAVLVFSIDEARDGEATLTLIGTGSGAYRPESVALAVPIGWRVEPQGPDSVVEALGALDADRRLWRVAGAALARTLDEDVYRIATGQAGAKRDRLWLRGRGPEGLESDDPAVELFAGWPVVRLSEGGAAREARIGEVRWRPVGQRDWRGCDRAATAQGLVDIAWRDEDAGFVRDRRRAFLLPVGAALRRRREGAATVYEPELFGAARLSAADSAMVMESRPDGALAVRFPHRPSRRARFHVECGPSGSIPASAPFPQRVGIASWSGELKAPHHGPAAQALSLRELADGVAFGEGRHVLRASIRDGHYSKQSRGEAIWPFRDELPLRGVADDLATFLSSFGDIEVWAELTFDFDNENARWRVGPFGAALTIHDREIRVLQGSSNAAPAAVVGRPLTAPAREYLLADPTPPDAADGRSTVWRKDPAGAWMVYLRDGEAVTSRPTVHVFGSGPVEAAPCGLAAAAGIVDQGEREAAMLARLASAAEGAPDTEDDIRWLAELAASLRGLPPASLDALRLLARCPGSAARVAFGAREGERASVIALADSLPFLWCCVPATSWKSAAQSEIESIAQRLSGMDGAHDLARQAVDLSARQITTSEPLLCWPLLAAGLSVSPAGGRRSLFDCAQDHVRRHGDAFDDRAVGKSLFRSLGVDCPRPFERLPSAHIETLDAPCAAAATAAGLTRLDAVAIRRIKVAARYDPIYFQEAFESRFVELMNARPHG